MRNSDGTYNGVKMMAQLSGLSEEEIKWTWDRLKELKAQGVPTDQAKKIVHQENPYRGATK